MSENIFFLLGQFLIQQKKRKRKAEREERGRERGGGMEREREREEGREGRRKRREGGEGEEEGGREGQTHSASKDMFLLYAALFCWMPYLVYDFWAQRILRGGICSSSTIQMRDWTNVVTCSLVVSYHEY